jgi:hypothetical protein
LPLPQPTAKSAEPPSVQSTIARLSSSFGHERTWDANTCCPSGCCTRRHWDLVRQSRQWPSRFQLRDQQRRRISAPPSLGFSAERGRRCSHSVSPVASMFWRSGAAPFPAQSDWLLPGRETEVLCDRYGSRAGIRDPRSTGRYGAHRKFEARRPACAVERSAASVRWVVRPGHQESFATDGCTEVY